jgi:hypothetical protein
MFYFSLSIAILIPLAIVAGLVFAYKKLPWKQFSILIVLVVSAPYLAYKSYERKFRFEVIPDALGVTSISYSKEESWGIGPGGNEAGIHVYPLPENVSHIIKKQGIKYFKSLPMNNYQQSRDWRGLYSDWEETPVKSGRNWDESKTVGSFNIYDYICAYGFCIDIKPAIVEEANTVINSPGSFYAYGRIGMIVVSPEKNLVMYFYNG